MKNDTKIEEELTFRFKIDMAEFDEFLPELKDLRFNGLLATKVYNVRAKKVQRNYLS